MQTENENVEVDYNIETIDSNEVMFFQPILSNICFNCKK